MYAQIDKPKESKNRAVAQKKSSRKQGFWFEDSRPETAMQRKLQAIAHDYSMTQTIQKTSIQRLGPPLIDSLKQIETVSASYENWKQVEEWHDMLSNQDADQQKFGQQDSTGLNSLANHILEQYPPNENIYVSIGSSSDFVAAYMKRIEPDAIIRWLPISAIDDDHQLLLEYIDTKVEKDSQRKFKRNKFDRLVAYIDKCLRLQGTEKDVVLLDATDKGNTQILLKGLIEHLYGNLTVRPVSLSRRGHDGNGGNRFNETNIELMNPDNNAAYFMSRIHQKFYKSYLGRSFGKTDIGDLLNNKITEPELSEAGMQNIDLFAALTQYIHNPESMSEEERNKIQETLEFASI